jgi:hypothetical protein
MIMEALDTGAPPPPVRFAAAHGDPSVVVGAMPVLNQLWMYPVGESRCKKLPLPSPPRPEVWGDAVAVASVVQGGHLMAVSGLRNDDPLDNTGRVWLYRMLPGQTQASLWGCIPGMRANFGRYLHVGQLTGDASEELLVADGNSLMIYDTGALAEAPGSTTCSSPLLPNGAYVGRVGCEETTKVRGCGNPASDFGRAVAMGDLDGDGRRELLVGMAGLEVDGELEAGAVLVYRVDAGYVGLLEARYLASASTGDRLGFSIGAVRAGRRDIVAAGAPGTAAFFLFYCSTLGGASVDSTRCQPRK